MRTVEMLCLANSRKMGGHCVAGLLMDGGGWIRPVSSEKSGTLQPRHFRLDDGSEPALLDVVRLELDRPDPAPWQPENWLITKKGWELVRRPATGHQISLVEKFVQTKGELIRNRLKYVSRVAAENRRVTESLSLIRPRDVCWVVRHNYGGGKQLRCRFQFSNTLYNLAVTDPTWENILRNLDAGDYRPTDVKPILPDDCIFTISLGEPFEKTGLCYKLIAAIFSI